MFCECSKGLKICLKDDGFVNKYCSKGLKKCLMDDCLANKYVSSMEIGLNQSNNNGAILNKTSFDNLNYYDLSDSKRSMDKIKMVRWAASKYDSKDGPHCSWAPM